jgi:hypothetical protein
MKGIQNKISQEVFIIPLGEAHLESKVTNILNEGNLALRGLTWCH